MENEGSDTIRISATALGRSWRLDAGRVERLLHQVVAEEFDDPAVQQLIRLGLLVEREGADGTSWGPVRRYHAWSGIDHFRDGADSTGGLRASALRLFSKTNLDALRQPAVPEGRREQISRTVGGGGRTALTRARANAGGCARRCNRPSCSTATGAAHGLLIVYARDGRVLVTVADPASYGSGVRLASMDAAADPRLDVLAPSPSGSSAISPPTGDAIATKRRSAGFLVDGGRLSAEVARALRAKGVSSYHPHGSSTNPLFLLGALALQPVCPSRWPRPVPRRADEVAARDHDRRDPGGTVTDERGRRRDGPLHGDVRAARARRRGGSRPPLRWSNRSCVARPSRSGCTTTVALAARLSEAGITSGMRVGLLFDRRHWIDLCVAYFAVQRLGAVTVTVSAELRRPSATSSPRTPASPHGSLRTRRRWNGPGGDPYQVLPVEPPRCGDRVLPPATTRPEQTADILYTSGTTGLPKAVVTPHALFTEVYARRRPLHGGIGPPILHAFPIGTAAALMMLYAPFQGIDGPGLTHPITRAVAALPEFNTNDVCKAVADCQVTLLFLTPAMLAHLTTLTSSQREMLASLEVIHCGSAPLNPAHVERIRRMLPSVRVVNVYGTTEAWPAMVEMPSAGADPDVVGRPARGTRIPHQEPGDGARRRPLGVHGRVEMSCPRFRGCRSYLHDSVPSKTFLPDGWTATGDIGHLDEEGNLHLSDRVSDVLNVGGEKLSARPVEIALLSHPMVEAAAVLGLPHPRLGEYVAAVVVLRPGRTSLDDIRVHLLERLPPKQIPRRVFAVGSMPVTENGKILRNRLKNSIARGEGTLLSLLRRATRFV